MPPFSIFVSSYFSLIFCHLQTTDQALLIGIVLYFGSLLCISCMRFSQLVSIYLYGPTLYAMSGWLTQQLISFALMLSEAGM
jgi:ascorbate-specific PTS system EIIC-type component UlaA